MSKSKSLALTDVRSIFELVGECRELGHDPQLWQTRMGLGLMAILNAQFLQGGEFSFDGGRPAPLNAVNFWQSAKQEEYWMKWHLDPSLPESPLIGPFLAQPNNVTCTCTDLIPRRTWHMSPFFNEVLDGLDDGLASRRPIANRAEHMLILSRLRSARLFTAREKMLLALFHDEIKPHLGRTLATSSDPVGRLSRRQRQVLLCLLQGEPEKQIARRLGIAVSTLHDHVKGLYRHFEVGSRPGLMAFFLKRGWKIP